VVSGSGEVVTRIATSPAARLRPGQFVAPHGVAVDSRGDIYVAQVVAAAWPLMYPDEPVPVSRPSLVKLARVTEPRQST
jgi:hypothetical protein